MSPTDPRHGTAAGYTQGCRALCCSRAKKKDRLDRERLMATGHEFSVPRERIVRKIHALMAMGHTSVVIGCAVGCSQQAVMQFTYLTTDCFAAVAERYDNVYRELEMQPPVDSAYTRRTKNRARREGWLPPLAWEDIDAGVMPEPHGAKEFSRGRLDYDVIDDVMQYHDFSIRLSPLEKIEVVRRWVADGRSERSLCALTGWREGRYR